jgi:hypothetical protein
MKFICEVPESNVDEILPYNDLVNHIEKDNADIENDTEQLYKYRRISEHQGPLLTSEKDYEGSTYNVLVERLGSQLINHSILLHVMTP